MKKTLFTIILFVSGLVLFAQQICLTNQEKELIELINQKRIALGYSECAVSDVLMQTANTNCKEILDETYVSHKPGEFGDYSGGFAEIRYGTSESNPEKIIKSLSFRSAYTDYSEILLSEEKYEGKNWQSIGICIRQEMIVIFLGEQTVNSSDYPICEEEQFFEFDPSSQYPTLKTHFHEDAIMRIYKIDIYGNKEEYYINTLSNFIDKETNLSLPLNENDIVEYEFYITPQKPPVVPQPPVFFSIKSSEKGDVYKTIEFHGNSLHEVEKYLAELNDINTTDPDYNEYTMLHRAVILDLPEVVNYLLEHGANINALSEANENPIHLVKSDEVLKILMDKGSKLDYISVDQTDLLYSIASEGLLESVKILVEKEGFDVNHTARKGDNALNAAVFNDHYKVAEYLLEQGANQVMGWLVYPIHDAVDNGNLEMVKLLVEYCADVNSQTSDGTTPLDVAIINFEHNSEIIQFLKENGADYSGN
ncbi:MAG: hypothetical protein C0596_08925 [Marinilabiliales bacterium]|nr:MAG: hypothetical protein C0596_08925 [Marinilabiliales bacterium]